MFLEQTPIDEISSKTGLSPAQLRGLKGSLVRAGKLPKKEE